MRRVRDAVVGTTVGKVEGGSENGVYVWRGIPYAEAPKGDLRFIRTRKIKPWEGVREAKNFGFCCPQPNHKNADMDEDCLTLNIWSPCADRKRRPVLFFIHGGSFAGGTGSEDAYNGAYLAGYGDVVVVTCNYRIGILGFLDFSFLDQGCDANCGLFDIIEALQWVHDNIDAFGGDPDHVTVFGQSAGGTATSVLATLPAAQGLLHQCIVMSGGPTLLQGKEEGQRTAQCFLEFMHIDTPEQLREIPAGKLAGTQQAFCSACGLGAGTFRISVDGGLVPDYPIPAAAAGAGQGIPMLIGTTREEMSFLHIPPLAKIIDIGGIMEAGVSHEDEACRECIPKAYQERYGKRRGKTMMLTDMVFRMGSVWFAQTRSLRNDVWMYRFEYETAAMKVSGLHTFHSSDIPFVFGNFGAGMGKLIFLLTPSVKKAKKVAKEIQDDFLAFARNGKLPWEKCTQGSVPAKCYRRECTVKPMVEPAILKQYESTHFKKTSFSSCAGK